MIAVKQSASMLLWTGVQHICVLPLIWEEKVCLVQVLCFSCGIADVWHFDAGNILSCLTGSVEPVSEKLKSSWAGLEKSGCIEAGRENKGDSGALVLFLFTHLAEHTPGLKSWFP